MRLHRARRRGGSRFDGSEGGGTTKMLSVLSDLGITALVAAAGVAFGWIVRSVLAARVTSTEEETSKDEIHRAREMVARLHEVAERVAADVGQHSHRVEAINEELHAAEVSESEIVVKAVAKLVQANNQMQQKLATAEDKLQEQAKAIQSHLTAARTDALTGLANRRAFDDEIARRFAEFQRHGRTFSVLMIDVDHFKKFNDTHGHQAGDEVLRGVGRVLGATTRDMDLVARYGGEEFAVVFPEALVADAKGRVERIRTAIESTPFPYGGAELHVTASLGIAHLRVDEDAAALIQRADAALYASKQAGRNCSHWHDGRECHLIAAAEARAADAREQRRSETARADAAATRDPARKAAEDARLRAAANRAAQAKEPRSSGSAPTSSSGGLYNRTEFCIVVGRRMAEWRRNGRPLSILLVQIDRSADIAGRHGELAAQLALRATSQFLSAAVREMDVAAQYDNTTFALLLPDADAAMAMDVAERLRLAIARCKLPVEGGSVPITVSIGGTHAETGDDLQRFLGRGEEALEFSRSTGGNRSHFHNGQACLPAGPVLQENAPS